MEEPKYGIVLLLDALGVRTYSLAEAEEFMTKLQTIDDFVTDWLTMFPYTSVTDGKPISKPQLRTFGDTFLITLDIQPGEQLLLQTMGMMASKIIMLGLTHRLRLRGAISIGHYYIENNKVVGPAISDAASWYEQLQMIGVIATPTAGMLLAALKERYSLDGLEFNAGGSWSVYDAPLKGGKLSPLYTVTWPFEFIVHQIDAFAQLKKTPKQDLLERLSYPEIPLGVENKYTNSLQYYDWCNQNQKLLELAHKPMRIPVPD